MSGDSMSTETETVASLIERLKTRSENAYLAYISQCRKDECLGWQAKVERGLFGWSELEAHSKAGELLGRHRALHEAAELLAALSQSHE